MAPVQGPTSPHDYTEGASPIDIDYALINTQRSRRDSQYSNAYGDGDGAVFDGPGHLANPSSVTRMHHLGSRRQSTDSWTRTRRRSYDSGISARSGSRRRSSRDSRSGRHSVDETHRNMSSDDEGAALLDDGRSDSSQLRPRHTSPSPQRKSSVFDNLAHLFGRGEAPETARRTSMSQRSSISRRSRRHGILHDEDEYAVATDDENERWGYSSGEEDSDVESTQSMNVIRDDVSVTRSMDYDSEPPSPTSHSYGIPLMTSDPVFGDEARLEMEFPFSLEEPPPPGPPSRQTIYIQDEDSTVRFVGYDTVLWRLWLWRLGCLLTLGTLGLVGNWFPKLWLRWVAQEKPFSEAKNGFIVVETTYKDVALFPLHTLEYPYPLRSVFSYSDDHVPDSAVNALPPKMNGNDPSAVNQLVIIDYRYTRFALDPRTGLFVMVRNWRDLSIQLVSANLGLDEATRQQRHLLFGRNEIDIEGKSTLALLFDEVIHPFYVFQIGSIILWSLDDYYYYAFCIALISISSIIATLIETKNTIRRMREMSRFVCKIDVLIDGSWFESDSTDLVPGDVINLSTLQSSHIPADLYLLTGDAIVNESMLTGESVPVSKIPVKEEDLTRWRENKDENPKCTLYGGTKVVRIRGVFTSDTQLKPALALVIRTGFNTTKGALVRSMLFPRPIGFKFYRDSVRFILVLAGIAGVGFFFSAIQFVRMGIRLRTIVLRALDLITVVVPPALPATLSIGTGFAIQRLRKAGIFCISPSRVNVGGKINVCCFDKTGTLTEDGLDILGVRGLDRNAQMFGELVEDVHDLPLGQGRATFLYALATCHSLKVVDGETIGDPLDVKMFNFTKWTLEEGRMGATGAIKAKGAVVEHAALVQNVVRPPGGAQFRLEDALRGSAKHAHFLELGVIRTFEFVSSLRRMSVIVKRLKSTSMEIYVKGAPEVMADICDRQSLPEDYEDLLSYYTKRGYRVIAIAGKSIEGLSWLKAQRMKREQAESELTFLGLVIFENRLKAGTTPAIQALRTAHIACRMITGDNPLTAVSVARECGLIHQAAHVFAPAFVAGNATTPASKVEWSCMDDLSWKLDPYSLKPLTPPPHHTVESDEISYQDYSLVISGDVFRWIMNHAPSETMQRMLVKTQIFARMSPDEKNEVVERLQLLGYTVLMCGDGANDCAALKAADVGISLSEAEASVAAPFTSSTPDIGCVLELIRQGRASLVTSFSCFKYMALYSLIQFTSVTLLYSFASSLGDFQFLYIDLFIIIPVAVAMGRTLPYPRIYPKPPTANLVSKKVLASIIGQIVITSAVQVWGFLWVRRQDWYTPPPTSTPSDDDALESTNYENSVLFLISCFQYILVAAVFSIGPPYRKSMWTNGWLMISVGLLSGFNILVLLSPPKTIATVLNLMPIPFEGRMTLLLGVAANVIMSLGFEQWGTQRVAEFAGMMLGWRRGKAYKIVESGMRV